jgi:ATP-dependent Lon protease
MTSFIKKINKEEALEGQYYDLSILPLRNSVAYPLAVLPLVVGISRSVSLIENALEGNRLIGLVSMKDSFIEEPKPGQVYETGTVARISEVVRMPNKTLQIIVKGLERFRVKYWLDNESYLRAHVELIPDKSEPGLEMDAMRLSLCTLAKEIIVLSPNIPDELGNLLDQIDDPRYLAYMVASNANLEVKQGQEILEADHVKDKLHALILHLSREKEVLTLGKKIQNEAREKIDSAQKEYYLRQQLKAIQKELGETEEVSSDTSDYSEKIEKAVLPDEAMKEAQRELRRLRAMSPQSPEYSLIKTYLDWLVDLPWNILSEDQLDIQHARDVLNDDHYDLQEVKDRIIEYLAVRKFITERGIQVDQEEKAATSKAMGAILCFVGPPGVGKTSLGQSIARALGRKFTRMSLGGMRDEAEIRGHRRTYIGAMPGRIIQGIKRSGTRNPVFMLDEVDKIGSDWRGDPSSALLEVLDPAQNHSFRDHYVDVDFDLSDVIFITTANQLETIPPPLRDRMEILKLDGYTEYEKVLIAERYLVPRQLKANGLREEEITFTDDALKKIIQDYTQEAGVRNLERQIGSICRKSVVKIAGKESTQTEITPEIVRNYLKKEKFEKESSESIEIPGIATGLAITAFGGDILFIEATRMKGKGGLTLTGQLGDVMRESAQIAYSYVRSQAERLNIDLNRFEQSDVHVHVPAGATPKDGPSAGLALVMAIASLFTGRPVRGNVGMTGEVTLRGRVLPVGGIKMKMLAGHRAKLTTIILPKRNERDLEELPDDVRSSMTFIPIEHIDDALNVALFPVKIESEKTDRKEESKTPSAKAA